MPYAFLEYQTVTPAIEAEVNPGNNSTTGAAEFTVGRANDASCAAGQQYWSADFRDVSENPWHTVTLTIHENGGTNGVQMQIDGGSVTNYNSVIYTTIDNVELCASAATAGVSITWHNITATFYKDGTAQETIATPDVAADTSQAGHSASQLLLITPTNSDNTKVVITAQVRMTSFYAETPYTSSLTGRILVGAQGVDGAQPTDLPSTLAIDAANLDLSESGGNYDPNNTNPLQAYYIPEYALYANSYVVIQNTSCDIYIYWNSAVSMWNAAIPTYGGLTWYGWGSSDVNNPVGTYYTDIYLTETGSGSILVSVVS